MARKYVPNNFNLLVVVAVAIGSTACSYGMAIISSTIGQNSLYVDLGLAQQGQPGYEYTSNILGAMNGVFSAGAGLAGIFCAWSANKIGRLRSIQIGCIVTAVGAGLCAGSVDVTMFLVARLVAGAGVGQLITAIPMYQAEVSTPETRGFMVSMHGIMFAVGYSLAAWIGFGCYFITLSGSTSSFPWRFPLAFQAVPSLLLLAITPWLPFSPRWLLAQGRLDEAKQVIHRLHYDPRRPHDYTAHREFYQMKRQLEMDDQILAKSKWYEIFRTPPNRKRAWCGFSLMFGNVFTGYLLLANYGVLLYESLGLTTYVPLMLGAFWVTLTFPGNVFTAFFIDRLGRRKFMLTGLTCMLISLIFEAALQAQYLGTSNRAGQRAAVFFLFFFILFWSTFMDATQYVYIAEIFPTHLRSAGMCVSIAGLYSASIIVLEAGPIALNNIKWKFFLVLIVPTFFHILNVYFFFPETKRRSLEDINAAFGDKVAVRFYKASEEEEHEFEKEELERTNSRADSKRIEVTDAGTAKSWM